MTPNPQAVGLIVCERAIIEEETRNVTLVNCFRRLYFPRFPSPPQRLAAHTVLTNGHGTGKVRLSVMRLDTLEAVSTREVQVTFPDPLREVRLLFRHPSLSFPAVGRYEVSLLVDGDPLTRKVIEILDLE